MIYRHKVEYTAKRTDAHYSEAFSDIASSQVMLNAICWHVGAKCEGNFAIKCITLECKQDGRTWRPV